MNSTGGRLHIGALVANVAEKPLANFAQERIQLVRFAFGDQFDATIGEIANVTADFVAASDRVRRVSKPDALHSPGILHGATLSRVWLSCCTNLPRRPQAYKQSISMAC